MYQRNGTYYTEEHSISFGELVTENSVTAFQPYANTWTDWHLIPSTRPAVAHPNVVTKFIEIPGADGMLDLSEYLSGKVNFGQRQGSFAFHVDNGHENWESLRMRIASLLHGKRLKMVLEDDPGYYYEGRFTVGNWETGADHSNIQITYQLDPYKMRMVTEGSSETIWDTFNFETDYDYSVMSPTILVQNGETKNFDIYSDDCAFTVNAIWVTGNVIVSFGGVTKTLSAAGNVTLGRASPGRSTLSVKGNNNGAVKVEWRRGVL